MAKKNLSSKTENTVILPLLTLENNVVIPTIPQPVKIENEEQREFLEKSISGNTEVFLVTANTDPKDPEHINVYGVGIIGIVDRVLLMPGVPPMAFIRPVSRGRFVDTIYSPSFPMAKVTPLPNVEPPKRKSAQMKMMQERVEELYKHVMQFVGDPEKTTAEKLVEDNLSKPVLYLYTVAHTAPISWESKYRILECDTYSELIQTVALVLDETEQKISLQASIHERTHMELSQQQREAFLRQHLRQVREELGETDDDDITQLEALSHNKTWPKEAQLHFEKELKKLSRLNVNNPEYSVQYAYLEAFLELPWNSYQHSNLSIEKVQEILDRDHYGLEHVKERILEYMAVVKLRDDLKAPILCLYGPPGVGKTSIGKSVAEAVGREYARISLGGMHDEAEIRGHRRTYIGAMPGRFLHALSKLKYGDPLILLDEIDKVGQDFKGDPSSALLEALDPEQNNTFHDNFIDFPYDLSKVLFIATANNLSTIPAPLRDRMEIIEMRAYTQEEKREIAFRHLIKQSLTENGFKDEDIKFTPEAVDLIIRQFTHESGVRQLKLQISKIVRKLALMKVRNKKLPDEITGKLVKQFLDSKDNWHNRLGFR